MPLVLICMTHIQINFADSGFQVFAGDVEIALSGSEIAVGKKFFDGQDVLALLEQSRGKSMPEGMRRQLVLFDLGLPKIFFHEVPEGTVVDPLIALAQEKGRVNGRPFRVFKYR